MTAASSILEGLLLGAGSATWSISVCVAASIFFYAISARHIARADCLAPTDTVRLGDIPLGVKAASTNGEIALAQRTEASYHERI